MALRRPTYALPPRAPRPNGTRACGAGPMSDGTRPSAPTDDAGQPRASQFPRTLKAAMALQDVSNAELADAMTARGHTMTANTISKILSGTRSCSWAEFETFAAVLGAPIPWLAYGPDWCAPGS